MLFSSVAETLTSTNKVKDHIIFLGTGQKGKPVVKLRLIEVRFGKVWYRYITSVLDPVILPPFVTADIYRRRWRIEEAFQTVKRLLNLSYLWTGSINGIKLQIWATWLFYAVADRLGLPFDRISLEMLYRAFYHFSRAVSLGLAFDPVNKDLGIVKRLRKPVSRLDLSPFPI